MTNLMQSFLKSNKAKRSKEESYREAYDLRELDVRIASYGSDRRNKSQTVQSFTPPLSVLLKKINL